MAPCDKRERPISQNTRTPRGHHGFDHRSYRGLSCRMQGGRSSSKNDVLCSDTSCDSFLCYYVSELNEQSAVFCTSPRARGKYSSDRDSTRLRVLDLTSQGV